MELRRFDTAQAYYDASVEFLVGHEAEHCILLGISAQLAKANSIAQPPYLAAIAHEGQIIAAALRTPPHHLVLSMIDAAFVDPAVALLVDDLRREYGTIPSVVGPKAISKAFAESWQQATGLPYQLGIAERLYRLEQVNPVNGVSGYFMRATWAHRDILIEWIGAFMHEALGEEDFRRAEAAADSMLHETTLRGAYIWMDGGPVSLAAATGPTPNGMRINTVYTPPEWRGRGYASACVARLSQRILDSGRTYCFLFTDLSNPTSNRIYQTIGYEPVIDVDMFKFSS